MPKAMANGDALDRELASLAETISLSNPLTYGHKSDWCVCAVRMWLCVCWDLLEALRCSLHGCRHTTKKAHEATAKLEGEFAKTLPKTFVLTEPRETKGAFAAAAKAAQHPIQPMRPNRFTEGGSTTKAGVDAATSASNNAAIVVASRARVPLAKRSHMDGVLKGIPSEPGPVRTTQTDAFVHDSEMDEMNQTKNTMHHRKRDAYSEYVEARARFSKMHSVN